MLMDKLRRRLRTSATRVLVPIIGSSYLLQCIPAPSMSLIVMEGLASLLDARRTSAVYIRDRSRPARIQSRPVTISIRMSR